MMTVRGTHGICAYNGHRGHNEQASQNRLNRTHRRHSDGFKRSLVEPSLQPGAAVARIARDNGINANQLFTWRKLHKETYNSPFVANSALLAMAVTPMPPGVPSVAAPVIEERVAPGILRLEFANARLTIEGKPDAELLCTVLGLLSR